MATRPEQTLVGRLDTKQRPKLWPLSNAIQGDRSRGGLPKAILAGTGRSLSDVNKTIQQLHGC